MHSHPEPTIRQLQYALAVAEHRHFRKAAEACHVTQPALSTQIQHLETLLGVQIFERDRRKVLVTGPGQEILDRARSCAKDMRELTECAARLRSPGSGPLRLGIIPTMAPYLLPRLIPRLKSDFAGYQLHLWEEQTAILLRRLDEGEVDLLFLALPIADDGLVTRDLVDEPFVLLTPEDHALASKTPLRETDLAGEEVLLLKDGHCLRDQALDICRLGDARSATGVEANSLATLVQLVASGHGITLLPASAVPVEARAGAQVSVRRFSAPEPARRIGAAWRIGSARESEFEILAEAIREEIQTSLDAALKHGGLN